MVIPIWNEPTEAELDRIPDLYSQDTDDPNDTVIYEKFYLRNMSWYIAEYDRQNDLFYGYVVNHSDPMMSEWGYVSYDELRNIYVYGAKVDRDLHFKPQRFGDIEEIRRVLGD